METPPRVWGRRGVCGPRPWSCGNTPTGVGKTGASAMLCIRQRKHPHGCGEDGRRGIEGCGRVETPPRVWGRPPSVTSVLPPRRNTPTGVGKTDLHHFITHFAQKHPHGCGEDHMGRDLPQLQVGNTPTGVGKTALKPPGLMPRKKHPHGCGEDFCRWSEVLPMAETPPRVWGRL